MSHFRKIDVRIWNDAKFNGLSDDGKLCFLFLLTHPHLTALGAMRATLSGLAEELGWLPEAFAEAFTEAFEKGLVKHDRKACFIWIPNFLKYNGPESPNVVRSWAKALDMLPECQLKNDLIQSVKAFTEGLSEGFRKALPEAFAKSMPNQEQEQEQEHITLNTNTPRAGEFAIFPVDNFEPSQDDLDYCESLSLHEPLDLITSHFRIHHREAGTIVNRASWSRLYRGWVAKNRLPPKVSNHG